MQIDYFNTRCEALLARYNQRNSKATTRHIDGLCKILREGGRIVVQTMFGGSVRKGTYVNGLSDVDILLLVDQSLLKNRPPAQVIDFVKETISWRMPRNDVESGKLAVTVGYSDGTEIQTLQAIRTANGVRVSAPGETKWSSIVQPDKFAKKLVAVNQENGSRVVPTIKLAKVIADCYVKRPNRKIAGRHIEALAIEAFRQYSGGLDPKSMLMRLLGHSIKTVLTPISDITGQTTYVDEYLGPENSKHRQRVSTYFGQMRSKIKNCGGKKDFDGLFCEGSGA